MRDAIKDLCLAHIGKYPKTNERDILKLIFQGEFGPGHLIQDEAKSKRYIEEEYTSISNAESSEYIEDIGFGFCRLHLCAIDKPGLSVDTLHRLFMLSALSVSGNNQSFLQKTETVKELCIDGTLPFSLEKLDAVINAWQKGGYHPFRHSEAFREAYCPAYRIIKSEYGKFITLFAKIDKAMKDLPHVILAVDGDAAAGKTTLSGILNLVYNCSIVPMDHFFLQPEQRNETRLSEPGGNIDYERFKNEVSQFLISYKPFSYKPFDCQIWGFGKEICVKPNKLTVVEGSYALHPKLSDIYNIKVFLSVDEEEQMRRIALRNGPEMSEKFRNIWIPMEKNYHKSFGIQDSCDFVF